MKKQILSVALLLIGASTLAGLIIAYDGCQTFVQPNPSTIPVTRTIHVRDGNGNDFRGADVQLYLAGAQSSGSLVTNSSPSTTGTDGNAVFTATVPPDFEWYICIVSATAEYPTIQDSVRLGCDDTTLEFTLSKHVVIPCATLAEQDSAKCHVCIAAGAMDSAFTPWLSFSCPNPVTVSATSSGALSLMTVTYYKKSGGITTGPFITAPTPLNPGDQLQAKIIYKPVAISAPTDIFTLTLTVGPTITYAFKVTGTAEDCTNCDCPASDFLASLPKPDTVCINTSQDTSIDLSSVHNPGDPATCSWLFTLQSDFTDNAEIVLSARSFSLAGGSSLGPLRITFSPLQNKVYDETATFSIQTQPKSGNGMACTQVLKVHFVGYGSGPSCALDPSDLLSKTTINGKQYNLRACVGQSGSKTLKIINTGACPVQNISLSFQNALGTLWQVNPTTIASIAPGQTVTATVQFSPAISDVFGAGDMCTPNPLTTDFANTLLVNGQCAASYPLTGYGDPSCHPSASFFLPDFHSKNEGVQIDSGTNVIHVQPQGDTTTWFLYATNLTASTPPNSGNGSVTLHGGIIPAGIPGTTPGVLCLFSANRVGVATSASGDACMIGCLYKGQCGLSDITNGVSSVVATPGDVFLFTYWTNGDASGLASHCGVIHVGEVHTDANLGYTVVDVDICFPIN